VSERVTNVDLAVLRFRYAPGMIIPDSLAKSDALSFLARLAEEVEQLRARGDELESLRKELSPYLSSALAEVVSVETVKFVATQTMQDYEEGLYGAIVRHHAARGHDRCWENDRALYAAAGLEPGSPELPPRAEFLKRCEEYFQGQSARHAEAQPSPGQNENQGES